MCAVFSNTTNYDCGQYPRSSITNKRKHDDDLTTSDDLPMIRKPSILSPFSSSLLSSSPSSSRLDHRFGESESESEYEPESSFCVNIDQDLVFTQFFVKTFERTLVFRSSSEDTVGDVLDRVEKLEGIPKRELRLIYRGRQLDEEKTLEECGVKNDSSLHLTGLLRSVENSLSWGVCNDIIETANAIRHGRPVPPFYQGSEIQNLETLVQVFMEATKKDDKERAWSHLKVFMMSGATTALVMLYAWKPEIFDDHRPRNCAKRCIKIFIEKDSKHKFGNVHESCAPIVLEFCRLLSKAVGTLDTLYIACRRSLADLLELSGIVNDAKHFLQPRSMNVVKEVVCFVEQVGQTLLLELSERLLKKVFSSTMKPLPDLLSEFSKFMRALQSLLKHQPGLNLPIWGQSHELIGSLFCIYMELLEKTSQCLAMIERVMLEELGVLSESQCLSWSFFLVLLTELNEHSKNHDGAGDKLHSILLERRIPLNALLAQAKRNDSLWWFLNHTDVTDFEARRNLVLMMFPEEKDDYDGMHEMLIDRSQLLAESYEYISHAEPYNLQNGIFMQFKNEEASGPGVAREWFCLLCQEIFNSKNVLFQQCPTDCRRFLPNPKSVVDPLHLEYFCFCGRIVALALMHKVQVGILFDRVFFLQLAGKDISLDDVRDADPVLYSSCRKILEMNAEILDSDALGLTFIREIDEMGSRRVVELCNGGEHIAVNSKNRQKYVDLLIHHQFVTSISQQVASFSEGFADILSFSHLQPLFFRSLALEDFDKILGGSEKGICLRDWKKHTEYSGYKEKDKHIKWFWKVVEEMTMEQQRILLIFWTAVRYLPCNGFAGLSSRLYIHRSSASEDHLPTSHTCFYQLCIPSYSSRSTMRARLRLVTHEHLSTSFGIW